MGDKKSRAKQPTRQQVNVRLTDDEARMIDEIAKENRMSKSDVVRFAIAGQLKEVTAERSRPIEPVQRKELLETLGKTTMMLTKVRTDNARLGNNVNQIARHLNSNVTKKAVPDGKVLEALSRDIRMYRSTDMNTQEELLNLSKELRRIWQSLV